MSEEMEMAAYAFMRDAEDRLEALQEAITWEIGKLREFQRKAEGEASRTPAQHHADYREGQAQAFRTAASRLTAIFNPEDPA